MRKNFKMFIIALAIGILCSTQAYTQNAPVMIPAATQQVAASTRVNALDVVANPTRFLNKTITVQGKFDKYSTLGLDYAPAMRSSEQFITFLIQRDDVRDHNVPLSEMKIFMKRAEAEKHIDLNAGDEIEFTGKVFSDALGDAWVDAEKFTVISKKEVRK